MKQDRFSKALLVFLGLIFLTHCGATTGGGAAPVAEIPSFENVTGIEISNQMSLVTAQQTNTSANITAYLANSVPTNDSPLFVPTGGAYATDSTEYFVYDEALDAIDIVNDLLCRMNQTAYADQVNQGAYKALIDVSQCSRRSNRANSSRNQSSSQQQLFEEWIINSTREDNESDQIVDVWFEGTLNVGGDAERIVKGFKGQLVVSEGVSSDSPFGIFSFNAAMYNSENEVTQTLAIDVSDSSSSETQIEIVMADKLGEFGFNMEAVAILDLASDSGRALVFRGFTTLIDNEGNRLSQSRDVGRQARVAFDENYYHALLVDDFFDVYTEQQCRQRNNYFTTVWEYNLYDENGARVSLDSGFPIQKDEYNGWAGYHGIWLPDEVGTLNGLEVTGNGQTYTIQQGQGLLIKRTKQQKTMADFVGDQFSYWSDLGELLVTWDGQNLNKIGEVTCGDSGCQTTAIQATPLSFDPFEWVGLYKEGLGHLDLVIPQGGLTNTTPVPVYTENIVNPDDLDSDLTLYCYFDCLKPEVGGLSAFDANEVSFTDQFYSGATPYQYDFSKSNYALSYGSTAVRWTATSISEYDNNFWGARSGAMTTTPIENPWEVWQQNVTYFWEVGPNSWNRFMGLADSNGDLVSFEPPLRCEYDDDTYGTFQLEYEGLGQLHGIPFDEQKNNDTGFSTFTSRFFIPGGTELTCGSSSYFVKPLVVEQFMKPTEAANCSDLTIPSDLQRPTLEYVDPEIGDSPTITSDPLVISGEVQDS